MSNYDNTNRGVLFDNDRKETDNHPDMTGSINIDGVEHWFSGWWKQGGRGQFLSLSIGKPKDQQQGQQRQQRAEPQRGGNRPPMRQAAPPARSNQRGNGGSGFNDIDDRIPF